MTNSFEKVTPEQVDPFLVPGCEEEKRLLSSHSHIGSAVEALKRLNINVKLHRNIFETTGDSRVQEMCASISNAINDKINHPEEEPGLPQIKEVKITGGEESNNLPGVIVSYGTPSNNLTEEPVIRWEGNAEKFQRALREALRGDFKDPARS